jgi:hypothetical protein
MDESNEGCIQDISQIEMNIGDGHTVFKFVGVIAPGREVLIGPRTPHCERGREIVGTIVQVSLRGDEDNLCILYEVAWWDGNKRINEWLSACEVTLKEDSDKYTTIGFCSNG